MPNNLSRTLQVKKVRPGSARANAEDIWPAERLMREIVERAPRVRSRHYPPIGEGNPEQINFFINRYQDRFQGVYFEYCSYHPGHTPMQMHQNLDNESVSIQPDPIEDPETGNRKEVVTITSGLCFGESFILENVRGNGGVGGFTKYLNYLIETYIGYGHPKIQLADVATRDLQQTIRRGNGVREVIMDLEHNNVPDDAPFSRSLLEIKNMLGRTRKTRVNFFASETLSEREILEAYEELEEEEGLDKMIMVMNNGERIEGLGKHKLRKPVTVEDDGEKNPNRHQLRGELEDYLLELQDPTQGGQNPEREGRVLDERGRFVVTVEVGQ